MSNREIKIPTNKAVEEVDVESVETTSEEVEAQATKEEVKEPPITKEESEYIEKVFFEDDEVVRLRDGKSYRVPPLGLRDGKRLMKKLNEIDTGVIVANLISDDQDEDKYESLIEVLLMAFKPYYPEITGDYLGDYVDIESAKKIIDIMIGLNGIKKSL